MMKREHGKSEEPEQGWWNRDWRDEAERRTPGLAYVAVMVVDKTDWDRLMVELFCEVDRLGVGDYVRVGKGGEVVSRLGVEAAKRRPGLSPRPWVDMRGQERRLLRVDLRNVRFTGHSVRGRVFAGGHHSEWWERAIHGPGSLLSWNNARIIDDTLRNCRWDESRVDWREKNMTQGQVFEWLGLRVR